MFTRSISLGLALGVALAMLGAGPARALHDPDITDEEFQCQYRTQSIAWRYHAKRIVCAVSCQRDARNAGQPPTDCIPPGFQGATQGCVNGAHGKAQGKICKACNPDVPECYPQVQTCPELADPELGLVEPKADALLGEIYCDESASGLTPAEGKCQDTVGKILAKFGAKKARCIAKCHAIVHKTGDTTIQCTPPTVNEPKTQYCLTKLTDYAKEKIDSVCDPALGGVAPECHAGKTSTQWIQEVEDGVDALDPGFNCGE
jgi:hypothetical protein